MQPIFDPTWIVKLPRGVNAWVIYWWLTFYMLDVGWQYKGGKAIQTRRVFMNMSTLISRGNADRYAIIESGNRRLADDCYVTVTYTWRVFMVNFLREKKSKILKKNIWFDLLPLCLYNLNYIQHIDKCLSCYKNL